MGGNWRSSTYSPRLSGTARRAADVRRVKKSIFGLILLTAYSSKGMAVLMDNIRLFHLRFILITSAH